MTNLDKIRDTSISAEELALFLRKEMLACPPYKVGICQVGDICSDCIVDWLNQEYKNS